MKLMRCLLVVCVSLVFCSCQKQPSEETSADAAPVPQAPRHTNLPHDLGPMPIPEDNPQTDAKVKLGHQLFFDKRLSVDGSRSCYSCHQNEHGNGGETPRAIGPGDKELPRHSPVIWNVGYLGAFYWDGRSRSLEEQALAAWFGGNMGVGKENLDKKAADIAAIDGYKAQFDEVFPGQGVTPQTIVQAIAAYERTLVCNDTAYDRYAKGQGDALTEQQQRGLDLFMGQAGCVACHAPPFFSTAYLTKDGAYFNVGIGTELPAEAAKAATGGEAKVDIGRMAVTGSESDWAAFKVPSLRNVAKSAPYFHDGSVATLEQVVRRKLAGGIPNKNLSPLLSKRDLSDPQVQDIVAFLESLNCEGKLEAPELP